MCRIIGRSSIKNPSLKTSYYELFNYPRQQAGENVTSQHKIRGQFEVREETVWVMAMQGTRSMISDTAPEEHNLLLLYKIPDTFSLSRMREI